VGTALPSPTTRATHHLACSDCDWRGEPAPRYACPRCGASLSVGYDRPPDGGWTVDRPGLWRYGPLLPNRDEPTSLGEGGTPLLRAARLGGVWLKNETVNPTGSFKDRPVSVATTMARELGLAGLLCASTGNTAVSVAAYGARAGLPVACLVPRTAPRAKLAQIQAAGALLISVDGSYSDTHAMAGEAARRCGWADLTSTYVNPYMLEGDKTVGLELFEQLGGRVPEWVVVPVGAGPLLAGVHKAFAELRALGVTSAPGPRLLAAQASACAPIARAFERGDAEVQAWDEPVVTAASSIADSLAGYADDGTRTLRLVRESDGLAIAADEDAIAAAARRLARAEGLLVEPGAAAAVAACERLEAEGDVVLLLTGHGLKDPDGLRAATGDAEVPPPVAPGAVDAVGERLERWRDG
jgi:threonine synthase